MTRAYNTATTQQNSGGAVNPFTVGKNAIINGDFFINQRNFTSNTADTTYNFDRWQQQNFGGTYTTTPQTFTPGAAPVSGYEGRKYLQAITATQSAAGHLAIVTQRIEDATRFSGQTVTISFWAKANTGTPKIGVEMWRDYGTGGSPTTAESVIQSSITLSTSWARYSVTAAIPSISGKTLGTTANTSYLELNLWQSAGANYNTRSSTTGVQNFTLSLWGVQVEAGSVATPFQTATGTIQGELAACQRYFLKYGGNQAYETFPGVLLSYSTTQGEGPIALKQTMRTTPTVAFSTLKISDVATYNIAVTNLTITTNTSGPDAAYLVFTVASGASSGKTNLLRTDASTAGYLTFSAEL
jgi:hypothetical protein